MKMKMVAVGALVGATLLSTQGIGAQERWGFDVRVGAALATEDLGDADLGTGLGFEGILMLRTMEHLFLYAGWDWRRFTSGESFAGSEIDFEETGYAFGVIFEHPLSDQSPLALQLRAGGTYDHIEVEDGGALIADSGHGVGWEVGTGLVFPIGPVWRLTPGIRYRTLSRDIEVAATTTPVDLSYLAFEIGVSRLF